MATGDSDKEVERFGVRLSSLAALFSHDRTALSPVATSATCEGAATALATTVFKSATHRN